ncbi:MAG: flagellar basal-body MS-ring/collar protein FliF [Bryobacteraceae bacterium]
MIQLGQLWANLVPKQRILLIAAIVAVVGGLFALRSWNSERGYEPLFSGMSPEDAGAVTAKLRESNTDYRLSDGGGTILVKSDRVAEMRLQLAAAGLPQTGRLGFEIFDQTNFGASEFTEQVNYHRAIEGELERSVMSLREVERARVHITMPKESLYLEARQPAKASILVKLRAGAQLSAQNIAAVTQLAASAVPGLQANQVTVLDTAGNLLNRPRPGGLEDTSQGSEAVLEYRKTIERDVQMKIAQTLEPLLGPDHFRVGVSADIDLSSGEQSEEIFDPNKSVMVASQTTQDMPAPGSPIEAGVPGTASNLPRATAAQASAGVSVTNYGRKTENTTFQTSRIVRHTKLGQGAVKKLSLSVLVDHSLRYDQGKPVVEAPTPEKLMVIKDLVTAAIGIDTTRGDVLVVEAFPFESTLAAQPLNTDPPGAKGTPVTTGLPLPEWLKNFNPMVLAGVAGGLLLAVLGGVFLLWKRGRKKTAATVETGKQLGSPVADAEREMEAALAEQVAAQQRLEADAILSLKIPTVSTKKTDVLTKHIASEVKKDPVAMAHVVRNWLNGEYQR